MTNKGGIMFCRGPRFLGVFAVFLLAQTVWALSQPADDYFSGSIFYNGDVNFILPEDNYSAGDTIIANISVHNIES